MSAKGTLLVLFNNMNWYLIFLYKCFAALVTFVKVLFFSATVQCLLSTVHWQPAAILFVLLLWPNQNWTKSFYTDPVHCTLYAEHCTLYPVNCTLCTVHSRQYTVCCILYNVHCKHCIQYTVQQGSRKSETLKTWLSDTKLSNKRYVYCKKNETCKGRNILWMF